MHLIVALKNPLRYFLLTQENIIQITSQKETKEGPNYLHRIM